MYWKLNYTCNLLFLLIATYFAQGVFYEQGSFISKGTLVIVLVLSLFYFVKTFLIKIKKSLYYKVLTSLILLNIFGFIFTAEYGNELHFNMFKSILTSLLPFYPFYYFTQRGVLKEKKLIVFFLLIFIISVLGFYRNQEVELFSTVNENKVNNFSYVFVYLIPYVFLFKQRKVLSTISMTVLLFFIILGAKRGAFITGTIGMIYFIYYQLSIVKKKNRLKGYFITIIGVLVLLNFFNDFYLNNDLLQKRLKGISTEGGSGRDIIYANIFDSWYKSDSFINLLFGFGFASSLQLSGVQVYAHNDWLELLSNFGLLGIIVYIILFFAAFQIVLNKKNRKEERILMMSIITMWFAITLFSMNYTASWNILQSAIMAFLIGRYEKIINKI